MKKPEIAKSIAQDAGLTEGDAADHLDCAVQEILSKVRKGEEARLPGLGRFRGSQRGKLTFQRDRGPRRG